MPLLYSFTVSVLRRINIYAKRNLSYSSIIAFLINEGDDQTILDIGVGTGYIANELGKGKKRFVVGIDTNRDILKSKDRLFHPVVADAHHIPVKNEVCDVILLISCAEHLDHPSACIKEISRVTKQNGLCITQLPNLQWPIEPHTKFPLLYLMPRRFSSIIKKSSGYGELNLNITCKKVLSWFDHLGFANIQRRKLYQLQIFRLLPWPLGWFLVFRRTG